MRTIQWYVLFIVRSDHPDSFPFTIPIQTSSHDWRKSLTILDPSNIHKTTDDSLELTELFILIMILIMHINIKLNLQASFSPMQSHRGDTTMNIGMPAPRFRVPCLLNGEFTSLSLPNLLLRVPSLLNGRFKFLPLSGTQSQPLVLCCVSSLDQNDAWLLEPQVGRFAECGAVLAVLVSGDFIFGHNWVRRPHEFDLPLLADPLGRLGRNLHLSRSLPPGRCETLFFDQNSRLQFRLIHDLNLRGITTVLEVATSDFCQRSDQDVLKSRLTVDPILSHCPPIEAPIG